MYIPIPKFRQKMVSSHDILILRQIRTFIRLMNTTQIENPFDDLHHCQIPRRSSTFSRIHMLFFGCLGIHLGIVKIKIPHPL